MSISSSTTPAALRVEIAPSRYFRVALIGIAVLALAAVGYAQLAWPLRLFLCVFALVYSAYCWRLQARQRGVLQWRSAWLWRGADGVERALNLCHSTVWPGLIVLAFRDRMRDENFVLTLCADSFGVDADSARRLRVYLHHFPVFERREADA